MRVREGHAEPRLRGRFAHDREPQARSRNAGARHPEEGIHHAGEEFLRNPGAAVRDLHHEGREADEPHPHLAPSGRIADGVLNEVPEEPGQRLRRHGELYGRVFERIEPHGLEVDCLSFRLLPDERDRFAQGFEEVGFGNVRLRVAPQLGALQRQELVDEAPQALDPALHRRDRCLRCLGVFEPRSYEALGFELQRRQGRAELMRRVRRKARFARAEHLDAGEKVVHGLDQRHHLGRHPVSRQRFGRIRLPPSDRIGQGEHRAARPPDDDGAQNEDRDRAQNHRNHRLHDGVALNALDFRQLLRDGDVPTGGERLRVHAPGFAVDLDRVVAVGERLVQRDAKRHAAFVQGVHEKDFSRGRHALGVEIGLGEGPLVHRVGDGRPAPRFHAGHDPGHFVKEPRLVLFRLSRHAVGDDAGRRNRREDHARRAPKDEAAKERRMRFAGLENVHHGPPAHPAPPDPPATGPRATRQPRPRTFSTTSGPSFFRSAWMMYSSALLSGTSSS